MPLPNILLFFSIILIPLQFLAIPVRATLIDISVIFYILYFFLSSLHNFKVFSLAFFIFIFYAITVSSLWQLSIPIPRILSSSFFFSFITSIYLSGARLPVVSNKLVSKAIEFSFLLSLVSLFFYFIGLNPFNLRGIFFSERAFASLYYCSSLAYFSIRLWFLPFKLSFLTIYYTCNCLFSMLAIIVFSSVHPLSLVLSLIIAFSYPVLKTGSIQLSSLRIKSRYLSHLIAAFLLLLLSVAYLFSNEHFTGRFFSLFSSSTESNLSALVYLAGFYQLRSSLFICPFTGCGPGSPGYLAVNIEHYISSLTSNTYFVELASHLNVHDLYSLFFRTITELGPIFGLLFVFLLTFRYLRSIYYLNSIIVSSLRYQHNEIKPVFAQVNSEISTFSIIVWCFVFMIGSLVKEPHLFRSITFLPIALGLHLCGMVMKLKAFSLFPQAK